MVLSSINVCLIFYQERFKIIGNLLTVNYNRPDFKRRLLHQTGAEPNIIKIIMQIMPYSTVPRITGRTKLWSTPTPMTNTSNVHPRWIGEENVGSLILPLCYSFQPPGCSCQCCQIRVIINRNKDINIFRISFGVIIEPSNAIRLNPGKVTTWSMNRKASVMRKARMSWLLCSILILTKSIHSSGYPDLSCATLRCNTKHVNLMHSFFHLTDSLKKLFWGSSTRLGLRAV